jgi:c-di-GMP-binding flagellar brake protein YcgR
MTKEVRRAQTRVDFKVAVSVERESRLQQFYSRNLSSGGIFLEIAGEPPPVGSKLKLAFEVPEPKKTIRVEAEVVHHHLFDSLDAKMRKMKCTGIGLKFLNIGPDDQKMITQFITGKDVSVRS